MIRAIIVTRDNCNAIIEISSNTLIAGCKSTIIPNSVTSIGDWAFAYCSGLTSVTCLAESVPTTNSYAFTNSSIGSATLYVPEGCKVAYEAADVWKDFKEIIEINDYGSCGDNVSYVFEEATGTLTISGTGAMSDYKSPPLVPWYLYRNSIKKVVLNNGVTTIGDYAFSGCSGLTSIKIPNSVTSIGGSAFSRCSGLTSIEIPKSVTSIRSSAFIYCSSLTSIKVESGNTTYDSRNNCNAIIETSGNTLIAGCKKTIIPNSVTSIGEIAFLGCSGLTTIEIPNSVTSIGQQAFEYCSGLTSTVISNSVTTIGRFAFDGCGNLTSVDIPNSVTSIGSNAFQGCFGLISIVIPNSVTTIGEGAFSNCTSLTSIKVESGNTTYDSRNNCNAIIETSSSTLIAGCKNTVIPNSVTSIGDHTFRGCSGLTSMVIPNSVTSIGFSAFNGCSGLTSIEIPNSVTSIGEWAFISCSGLTSIGIPNSVTTIGNYAFSDCSGLTSVTCLAEKVPTTNSYAFTNSPIGSATLYVPKGCKTVYEAADVWKDFKEIVEIEVAPTPSSDALISVQDTKAYIGKTVSVDIDLNNSTEDLTAYQFDLTLPDGISLSMNDKGKFLVTKTSRCEDDSHTLNISKLEGNTYRFVCFSMSNEVITGTSGAILNASLTIGESVSEGSYEATISNIVVTKTNGTQLKLSDAKFNIVVSNVVKGDANGDGEVNVSDIVEIVNYIMNKPSDKFVFAAADVNEDGEVNVTDIVKVVSIIMSANSSQAKMSAAQTEMTDNDQVQLVDNEDQTISLTLNNEGGYVASQFDLVLSDNQSLESITLNNNRTDNHILVYTKTDENRYRVLSYSLNNATYDGHSGELLDIKVAGSGNVSVEDILFVTAEETEKRFSTLHSVTTGISMTTKQAEAVDIYSVDGRLVHKQAKSMDGLERGIYIINGKKHIVR